MTEELMTLVDRYAFFVPGSESSDLAREDVKRAIDLALQQDQPKEIGKVVVTWNLDRTKILAVTRQDEDGKILKVIAEAP